MNHFFYRLIRAQARLEEEIGRELKKRLPNSLRLLRLRALKLAMRARLDRTVMKSRRV